ncbi:MAG: DNA-directed RNA polymerase subunit D [Candidatus Woesearchaeota archaeon]|jgi:DNA-directed RNA polymerase subunit D
MKLTLIKKKKGKITFEIKDENVGYVNTLRRIFSTEVPTMAISTVEFKQNSSALYDEIVAHRLGLVALKTDLDSYNIPKEGAPESTATHVSFTLKAVGPKTIYASDLKSNDSKVVPVFPETIILKLFDKQEIELVAVAHLGIGKEHVKWSPCLASYYYKPKITVNNKSLTPEILELFPPQIKTKGQIDLDKIDSPELIDACRDIDNNVLKIEYENPHTDFVFTIESWGQLSPEKIVEEGVKQYNAQLDEFKKLIKDM